MILRAAFLVSVNYFPVVLSFLQLNMKIPHKGEQTNAYCVEIFYSVFSKEDRGTYVIPFFSTPAL